MSNTKQGTSVNYTTIADDPNIAENSNAVKDPDT